jgi:hypothetical protein
MNKLDESIDKLEAAMNRRLQELTLLYADLDIARMSLKQIYAETKDPRVMTICRDALLEIEGENK